MFEIKGKYTNAKVMIDDVEETAIGQVTNFVNHPVFVNPVVIMPDCHAGKGAVVGTATKMTEKIIPNIIGVDVGCGVLLVNLGQTISMPLSDIDKQIRAKVPFGNKAHENAAINMKQEFPWDKTRINLENFSVAYQEEYGLKMERTPYTMDWFLEKCREIGCDTRRAVNSIGSAGGGNHAIEIGRDSKGDHWLMIHSGSRNFGKCVCDYWQGIARKRIRQDYQTKRRDEIDQIKARYQGDDRYHKIQEVKKKYGIGIDTNGLEWLEGNDAAGYLKDMIFAQEYASLNRAIMASIITEILKVTETDRIESVHNYINFQDFIIRKGAIKSYTGERMCIPLNMRDGVLICEGLSNESWLCSAPHGAGRLMSRSKAKKTVDIDKFQKDMEGIYSSSVGRSTLDEAPDAYKDSKVIEEAIKETAAIIDKVKPILNLKDGSGSINNQFSLK